VDGDGAALRPAGQHVREGRDADGGGAFRCGSPEEVDQVYRELLAAGGSAHNEPWDAFWGQRYAQVVDPDGNVVDLFAALPGREA
jgi:uncharacterized glyoxalase superfamily protein PhnB